MKKLLILFLSVTTLLSCASDEGASTLTPVTPPNSITPPSWIQGSWSQRIGSPDNYTYLPTFRFKPNDFCSWSSNTEACFGNSIQQSNGSVTATQVISNNEYKLTITIGGSQTTVYHFVKITDTKIEYLNPMNGVSSLELFKQ